MPSISRFLCASVLACTVSTGFAAGNNPSQPDARMHWHQAIQSGYQSLAKEADELRHAAEAYCEAPHTKAKTRLEQEWLDAMLAWQRVRFVDFGPVERNNLSWQFQFWPDPKNLIARKAGNLLGSDQPISDERVDRSGVAVQGFPMLEYLIFDEAFAASERALPAKRTCTLLTAVARHIHANSQQVSTDWQDFKTPYLNNEPYRDTTIKAGMAALEILEERRLAQPMGLRGNGKRNLYITDAWRSGASLQTVEATVQGLQQQFLPGLKDLLEQSGEAAIADRINRQFTEVLDNFPAQNPSMAVSLTDGQAFRALQNLYVDVSQLTTLVNDEAAVALGVVRGFNSSDGD